MYGRHPLQLVEQGDRAYPAGRAVPDLVRETGNDKTGCGKLLQIGQLLHVAIGSLTAGIMTFPDDAGIPGLLPAAPRMGKRGVPSPGVDAGDAHASPGEVERRLPADAAACAQVFVRADQA